MISSIDILTYFSFRIQSFQRKHDVLAILIIFDSRGVDDAGPGYRHPRRDPNTSEQFPVVLSCPAVSVYPYNRMFLGCAQKFCFFNKRVIL